MAVGSLSQPQKVTSVFALNGSASQVKFYCFICTRKGQQVDRPAFTTEILYLHIDVQIRVLIQEEAGSGVYISLPLTEQSDHQCDTGWPGAVNSHNRSCFSTSLSSCSSLPSPNAGSLHVASTLIQMWCVKHESQRYPADQSLSPSPFPCCHLPSLTAHDRVQDRLA